MNPETLASIVTRADKLAFDAIGTEFSYLAADTADCIKGLVAEVESLQRRAEALHWLVEEAWKDGWYCCNHGKPHFCKSSIAEQLTRIDKELPQ